MQVLLATYQRNEIVRLLERVKAVNVKIELTFQLEVPDKVKGFLDVS